MLFLFFFPGFDPNMMDHPPMGGPGGPMGPGGPPGAPPPQQQQQPQQPPQYGASNLDDLQSLMDMEGMGDWWFQSSVLKKNERMERKKMVSEKKHDLGFVANRHEFLLSF